MKAILFLVPYLTIWGMYLWGETYWVYALIFLSIVPYYLGQEKMETYRAGYLIGLLVIVLMGGLKGDVWFDYTHIFVLFVLLYLGGYAKGFLEKISNVTKAESALLSFTFPVTVFISLALFLPSSVVTIFYLLLTMVFFIQVDIANQGTMVRRLYLSSHFCVGSLAYFVFNSPHPLAYFVLFFLYLLVLIPKIVKKKEVEKNSNFYPISQKTESEGSHYTQL